MTGNSFQIGKIFGISIRIDYTWFVIFFLVAWSLGSRQFRAYPNWSYTMSWIMGIITAIIFFASVLAHELAHSLVSKARGVPVKSITLFIFGGVAQISDEPKKPSSEFWMALAGPATSLALGAFFGLIYLATGRSSHPVPAVAWWLFWINVIVAGFNLIPGFPLDGGRILRSIIWRIKGNLRSATRIASTVGRIVAYLFILWGVRLVFADRWFDGIWFVFIGWFLERAASSSYRQLALREMLKDIKVRTVMVSDCPALNKDLTIRELVDEYILHTTHRCFPVVEDDHVLGIVTLQDVKEVPREKRSEVTVEQVMISLENINTIDPESDLYTAMKQMATENTNQLPVVENGELVGMISRDNLMNVINVRSEFDT